MKTIEETKKTYNIKGYHIVLFDDDSSNHIAEVWNNDKYLFSIKTHDEKVIEIAITAYKSGFNDGKNFGRCELQREIQQIFINHGKFHT